jgi:hypothetical protein
LVQSFKKFNAEFEDGDNLRRFFLVLKKFNGDMPIKGDIVRKIEYYFDHRWQYDKNFLLICEDEGKHLF